MAPSAVHANGSLTNDVNGHDSIDTMHPHDSVKFAASLKPKPYQMKGTPADSKVLFLNVNILDSTGRDPYRGDVYIEGKIQCPLQHSPLM